MQQEYPVTLARLTAGSNALRLSKEKELVHLLKRALIGVSFSEYLELEKKPLPEVIRLLTEAPLHISSPLKDYSSVNERNPDYKVKIGETWVNDVNFDYEVNAKRKQSLRKWLMGTLYTEKKSFRPTMVLFWHYYFPIQIQRITVAAKAYDYFSTVLHFSLENYKDMVLHSVTSFTLLEFHKKISTGSNGLFKTHSQQLLHYIFGPEYNDHLSKDRIKRFTRLVSEWNRINDDLVLSVSKSHADNQEKNFIQYNALSLPEIYKKPVIREFIQEATDVINRLLQFEQAAVVLAEKLFRWFIHSDTEKRTSKKIIRKVALAALENKYDIKKILPSLFLQEDIYTTPYFGSLTKQPVEFVFGLCKELQAIPAEQGNAIEQYQQWEWLLRHTELPGFSLGDPVFDMGQPFIKQKGWITSEVIRQCEQLISRLLSSETINHHLVKSDVRPLVNYLVSIPSLDRLIDFFILHFTHTYYSPAKKQSILQFIQIQYGVTHDSWTTLTAQYREQPHNVTVRVQAITLVKNLLEYFLKTPEYYYY